LRRDLELGWEEKPVGQALDMHIGQKMVILKKNSLIQVITDSNNFLALESLTGNIAFLRMKDGGDPLQIWYC